ncbi:MAG: hypothetical protein K2N34_05155, partial [Lachnospiraceae bacterium]|nr:hypothetical protein [Lachnospiraceae bacterium]
YVGFCNALFGTIKNLTVEGNMTFHANCEHIGGIAGCLDGGTISNVTSIVNISNTAGELKHVGGIVGTVEKTKSTTATVDKCLNYGSINISNSTDCIGGIAAYTNTGGRISNCANFGNITTTKAGAYTGGILGYINNTEPSIKDCYNYGSVSNSGDIAYCGAIIGWARNYTAQNISNNYYLDSSASLALGKDSKTGADIESKNSNQFSSGEVAYLLNNKVTDGTQAWYQTIGKEVVPVLNRDSKTVYKVTEQLCPGSRQETVYSNTNENKCGEHNFVNGKCTYCGLEQQKEFDEDIEGNLIIKTYDDLVKLAQLIRSDYDTYGSKDYILVNNIIAPSDSVWTMGIGSVAENKPFNGTFKGDGYCIMGLNIDASLYGGLFEIIGENGHVQNLFILNCTYMTSCENASSIAAINNGTIDYCTNGMTVGSAIIFTNPVTKNPVKASEFNSEIKGTLSGGIAAQNTGVITGCRNAGTVLGTECGGIAGINTGKIYGCVNNGAIGYANSSLTQTAGGIAGKNGGSIASSYNSSSIYGKSGKAVGSIAGLNGFDSETSPEIRNVFYITINGLHGVGTDSLVTNLDVSNIVKKQNDMKKDSFTDELNSVTDDSVSWCRSDTLNNGYPKVENIIFERIVRELNNGIKLKGSMHSSLNISCDLMEEGSTEYKNLVSNILTNRGLKVLKGYSLSLSDKEGNPMFADLWIQGDVELSIPVDSEHVMLLALDSNGQVKEYKPISFINGAATFRMMAEPISFILVDSRTDIANTTVKTGDLNNAVLWFLTLISGGLFVAVAWQKRKKTNE